MSEHPIMTHPDDPLFDFRGGRLWYYAGIGWRKRGVKVPALNPQKRTSQVHWFYCNRPDGQHWWRCSKNIGTIQRWFPNFKGIDLR